MRGMLVVALAVLLAVAVGGCLTQSVKSTTVSKAELESRKSALEAQISGIDNKLAVIDAEIRKHQSNIERMRAILKEAKQNRTQPDVSRLSHYATAAGQRTEKYEESPQWLKNLIDEFEDGSKTKKASAAATLAILSGLGGVARAHYIMEISRSNQFIQILERERKKLAEKRREAALKLSAIEKRLQEAETAQQPGNVDGVSRQGDPEGGSGSGGSGSGGSGGSY
jgi:chromosome segregation ATPase